MAKQAAAAVMLRAGAWRSADGRQRQRGKAVLANARSTASRQRAKCNGGVSAAYRKRGGACGESVQMAAAYAEQAGMRWRITAETQWRRRRLLAQNHRQRLMAASKASASA
jgi:hypothetical protein